MLTEGVRKGRRKAGGVLAVVYPRTFKILSEMIGRLGYP